MYIYTLSKCICVTEQLYSSGGYIYMQTCPTITTYRGLNMSHALYSCRTFISMHMGEGLACQSRCPLLGIVLQDFLWLMGATAPEFPRLCDPHARDEMPMVFPAIQPLLGGKSKKLLLGQKDSPWKC